MLRTHSAFSCSSNRLARVRTVKAGHDTNVKVGVLRVGVAAGKQTRVAVMDAGKEIASGHEDNVFGLPPGSFDIQVAGQTERVTVSEGQVTEF